MWFEHGSKLGEFDRVKCRRHAPRTAMTRQMQIAVLGLCEQLENLPELSLRANVVVLAILVTERKNPFDDLALKTIRAFVVEAQGFDDKDFRFRRHVASGLTPVLNRGGVPGPLRFVVPPAPLSVAARRYASPRVSWPASRMRSHQLC